MNRLFQVGGDARGRKARMGEGYPSTTENMSKVSPDSFRPLSRPFPVPKCIKGIVIWIGILLITGAQHLLAADELLSFLQNAPPVKEVIFSIGNKDDGKSREIEAQVKQLVPGAKIKLNNVDYYIGARQRDDFFIRSANSIEELKMPMHNMADRCFGRTAGTNWTEASSLFIDESQSTDKPTMLFAHAQKQILNGVLNVGILALDPDSGLDIKGYHWTARAFDGELLSGEFFRNQEGRVEAIEFRKGQSSSTNRLVFEYDSTEQVPAFYPTRISRYNSSNMAIATSVIEIHAMKLSDHLEPPMEFMAVPRAVLGTNRIAFWVANSPSKNGAFRESCERGVSNGGPPRLPAGIRTCPTTN